MNEPYQMTDPQIAEMIASFEEHYDIEWSDPASSQNARNWEAAWSKACEFTDKWGHHKPILLGMGDIPVTSDTHEESFPTQALVLTAETQVQKLILDNFQPVTIDELKKSYSPGALIDDSGTKTLEIKI